MVVNISCSPLIPYTLWKYSSQFNPPTSVCRIFLILSTQWNFCFGMCHCSLLAILCVSVGTSPSPPLSSHFCSSPGLCYIMYSSSKLCISQSSYSTVTIPGLRCQMDKARFAHTYNLKHLCTRVDRQSIFFRSLFAVLSISLLVATILLLCLPAAVLLVYVASWHTDMAYYYIDSLIITFWVR